LIAGDCGRAAVCGATPRHRSGVGRVLQELNAPLVAHLESWLREQRAKLSRGNDLAKAMDYMLKRWPAFTRFLDDGRICLSNNAAERALRGIALGRKSWLFAGSDCGGQRAAVMYSLIVTAKLNDVDPQPGWPTSWPGSPAAGCPATSGEPKRLVRGGTSTPHRLSAAS